MSERTPEEVTASVEAIVTAYVPATVIFAAVELDVFAALAEPRTSAALAAAIGATEDGAHRLARALVTLGFLREDGDRFVAPPEVRAAFAGEARGVVGHHRRHVLPPLLRLADAVRTGRDQHASWSFSGADSATPYDALGAAPDEYRLFLSAMDRGSRGVGAAIARLVDLSRVGLLIDLGGGGGIVARELLGAVPTLRVRTVDLPAAAAVARERSVAAGLADRHDVVAGDLRAPLPPIAADAVLLSAVLADFPADERAAILANARAALRPGGRLLVSETLFDDDRRGPPNAALFSLLMLAAMRGDQLSAADLRAALATAGFGDVRVHRGPPRDLVVATAA